MFFDKYIFLMSIDIRNVSIEVKYSVNLQLFFLEIAVYQLYYL
jgi:hypothetical protein